MGIVDYLYPNKDSSGPPIPKYTTPASADKNKEIREIPNRFRAKSVKERTWVTTYGERPVKFEAFLGANQRKHKNKREIHDQKKNKGKEEQSEMEPKSPKFRSHTCRLSDISTAALLPAPIFEEVSIETRKAFINLGGH